MSWDLQHSASAQGQALHLFDEATAFGDNPAFPCPLPIPTEIRKELVLVSFEIFSGGQSLSIGQMGLHRAIVHKVKRGIDYLTKRRFPIASMVPIVRYGWSDLLSMAANNTSGFNYRYKTGSTTDLSLHAYGLAFDINPWWNPCRSQGIWLPEGACHDEAVPGTITKNSWVAQVWRDLGFTCGVDWEDPFDPQHIQMPLEAI